MSVHGNCAIYNVAACLSLFFDIKLKGCCASFLFILTICLQLMSVVVQSFEYCIISHKSTINLNIASRNKAIHHSPLFNA